MKIAIAGFGLEGESSYRYWSVDPKNEITIVDENHPTADIPQSAFKIIGEGAFSQLQDFDIVVRTAGLAPRKIKTNGKIWSATNEFFEKCPAKIIGVTGSKGKGTTASLIASILKEAGKKVWLLGNIGKPALDVLNEIKSNDIVVYELSSFQLWDIKKSPHIAVILFIEREHQDVHVNIDEYISAKANITNFQSKEDILIYNIHNNYAQDISSKSNARLIGYVDKNTAHIEGGSFYYSGQKICSVSSLKIMGDFNKDNACAAIDAVWSITNDIEAIEKGISAFHGLPHRLEFIRELNGVKYYDDSIATTPGSAIAALRSFDSPKVIILGGSSKGSDFTELGQELAGHDVKALIIGDEAKAIANACINNDFLNFEIIKYTTMLNLVDYARSIAKPDSVILLSPASASFGLFKNYVDRGEQFDIAVRAL